ncbi:hypothetical protein DA803_00195 [[Mycoplasma] phocae]|uniref:Uncharacterized protein n=2 Tax=[Mycoplasma] phocae TaxID=142651 RepID=A0A2Z5IPW3_9BACT|nr:hypothetical protein DA803_00195 [[Mycoplasma] phocae]
MFLRIVGAALIGVGIYYLYDNISEYITENRDALKNDTINGVLDMIKILWSKNMLFLGLVGAGVGIWAICYIFAIIVISLASWKGQALGRALLIIATILFPVPVLPSFGLFFVAISPQKN